MDNLGWAKLDRDTFRADFENTEDLLKKFDDGTLDPNAWKALKDRLNLKKDLPTLTAMTNILKNPKAKAIFGTDADLQAAMKKFTDTHASPDWSWNKNSLEFHLNLLNKHIDEFQGVDGFDKSIKDAITNANPAVQDGFWHGMKVTDNLGYKRTDVSKFDMEFEAEGLPCERCKFDLELSASQTDPNALRLIEFKSYADASKISLPQFTNYLGSVISLKQMKYYFNAAKLTTPQAKEGMKAFLKTNASNIFKEIDAGGIGKVKFEQLFGVKTPSDLIDKLDTTTGFNEILKFVESI
jgi:hypothetical protein